MTFEYHKETYMIAIIIIMKEYMIVMKVYIIKKQKRLQKCIKV